MEESTKYAEEIVLTEEYEENELKWLYTFTEPLASSELSPVIGASPNLVHSQLIIEVRVNDLRFEGRAIALWAKMFVVSNDSGIRGVVT